MKDNFLNIPKTLKIIEGKRNSPHIFWKVLVSIKDRTWFITNFIERRIFKIKAKIMLKRIDNHKIPQEDEIRLFMSVRNESLRLPNFFEYYHKLGVDRFFIIDNDSTDETLKFLKKQKNVHIFHTKQSFTESKFAVYWLTILLKRYGVGHWCLITDADEILKYPNSDKINLKKLCEFLDLEKATSLKTLMLDMYSDKSINLSHYDHDYMKTFLFFENTHYLRGNQIVGGVRERVFGVCPLLDKTPLFKYNPKVKLLNITHKVSGTKNSSISGVLLHFKYSSDFIHRVFEEVERKEHLSEAVEYEGYAETLTKEPNLNLYYNHSIKYKDTQQLVNMKIMNATKEFEEYTKNLLDNSRG